MSGLFGHGATINNEEQRIGALRIQSSTQGLPIPIVYGKVRMSPNLIDYRGFTSVPVTSQQKSGKGGGGVTTVTTNYNYFVAPMLSLCEGPLTPGTKSMIDKMWVDKVVTSGANLGMVEFLGSYTQAPWSYMTTNYPTAARGLRGQAYAAHPNFQLGGGGAMQNLSFEVRARLWLNDCEPDVNVGLVVPDLLSNVNYGLGFDRIGDLQALRDYCDAAGFRVSPAYTAQRPASEMVAELAKAANAAPFWSDGLLKIIPYADTVVSRTPLVSQETAHLEELFVPGLSNFTTGAGNQSLFTVVSNQPYGNAVHIASQNANTVARITRTIATQNASHVDAKFRVTANGTDDAGLLGLSLANNINTFVINPKREAAVDANQRLTITMATETVFVGNIALPQGVWFKLAVDLTPGANQSTWALSGAANGVTVQSGVFAGNFDSIVFDALNFEADSAGTTAPSEFADVHISRGNDICVLGNTTVTYTPDLTVQYALTTSDFITSAGSAPVKITRVRQADAYNVIQVSCLDRNNDYNKAVVEASDLGSIELYGRRVAPVIQAEMICDLEVARAVAQAALQRAVYLRNKYEFTLGWRHGRLEPMDIVTLTDVPSQLSLHMVRITATNEADDDQSLDIEAEDVLIGVGTPGTYAQQAGSGHITNTGVDPGDAAVPVIFQPPIELSGTPQIWIGSAGGANWGGAEVWASDDNATYAQVGVINGAARYGTLTANWPQSFDPDTTGNLSVNLTVSNGTLTSVSNAQADSFDSISFVGTATGGELIAYSTATLTGPNAYTMGSYIRRALFCGFASPHLVGESFMRLDAAVAKVPIDAGRVGHTVYIKLRSFNTQGSGLQDLSALSPITYVVQPVGLTIVNGAIPSLLTANQVLCVPDNTQYSVQSRMTVLGRVNLHGRLICTA